MGVSSSKNQLLVRIRAATCRFPGAFVAGSFFLMFGVYSTFPSTSLLAMTVQSLVLAALGLSLVFLWASYALKMPTKGNLRVAVCVGIPVLVIAAAGLFQNASLLSPAFPSFSADFLGRLALIFVFCLATGVFEEGLFRIIVVGAINQTLSRDKPSRKYPHVVSAFISALVFGLLHVGPGLEGGLKVLQAFLFGIVMAALYARTRNLWPAAFVHGLFNLISMGPYLLIGDYAQSLLLTGAKAQEVLVLSSALLAIFAIGALVRLFRFDCAQRREKKSDSPSDPCIL